MEEKNKSSLMHEFKESKKSPSSSLKLGVYFLVIVLLGVGTGYLLSSKNTSSLKTSGDKAVEDYSIAKGKTFGTDDTKAFSDTAEGRLEEGGVEGEGAYHLVRTGGESQSVYLISSTVDLSQLVGRNIKVWGRTQTAQHVGWLMDVGRVEVL